MGKRLAAFTTMALLVGSAAVAEAAPVAIGTGDTPRVVPGPDGTLHAAWVEQRPDNHEIVHYCRIAPGGTACAGSQQWDFGTLGSVTAEITRDPSTGHVDVIALSYASSGGVGNGEWLIESTAADAAGDTFAAPKKIANVDLPFYPGNSHGGGAIFGPGAFQVGVLSDANGADLQLATTNAGSPSYVLDNDVVPTGDYQAVGLVNATTVMVIARQLDTDGGALSWRRSNGSDDARNLATWGPVGSMTGVGSSLSFAANGVAAPVVASVDTVSGNDTRIALRHYDATTNTFSAPSTVTDLDATYFLTAGLDPASNVHVAFTHSVAGDTEVDYLASPTGDSWPANPLVLAPFGENIVPDSLRVAAGPDGNGAVFWRRPAGTGSSADDTIVIARVNGPSSAFPQPPAPPSGGGGTPAPPPGCVKTPSLGIARFLATGCFTASGSKLTTTQPFLLNGMTFDPAGKTVTLDTAKRTFTTPAGVKATLGPMSFGTAARSWTFPTSGSFVPPPVDFDKAGLGGALLKLPLAGDATMTFLDAKLQVATHMQLPAPFSSVNGDVTLKADNFSGLQLDALHINVATLPYGFKNLDLQYVSDPPTWSGHLEFAPPVGGGDTYEGTILVVNGTLQFVKVEGQFAAPGKEIYPPFLYLRDLGLTLQAGPPIVLTGSTILTGGPGVGDTSIVSIGHPFDAFGTLSLTLTWPFKLDAQAPIYVLGFHLGDGELHYTFPGDVSFAAHAALGSCSSVGAQADISGFLKSSSATPEFNAKGSGEVCLGPAHASAEAVVSSKGIAACGHIGLSDVLSVDAGAGHFWDESGVHLMFKKCSTGPYEVSGSRQAGAVRTFNVAAGLKQLDVQLTGDTAPPLVTITAPGGAIYTTQADGVLKDATHIAVADAAAKQQTLLIPRPAAGTWTVTSQAGSAAITKLDLARDVPAVRLTGQLRKAGKRRVLRWNARAIAGQTVDFYEEGDGVLQRIGSSSGARGTIAFTPVPRRGGRRKVTAIVAQGGLPRTKLTLAGYVLPRPPKPGAAHKLRTVHRGRTVAISWKPGARAAAQELRVVLGDGTKQLFRLRARARTLLIRNVRAGTTGTVFVTAIRADGVRGPTVRARVRAR